VADVLLWGFLILLIPIGAAPIVYIIYMCLGGFKRYNDINLARNGYSPEQIAQIRQRFQSESMGFRDYIGASMGQGQRRRGQSVRTNRSWEGFE